MTDKVTTLLTGTRLGALMGLYAAQATMGEIFIRDEVRRRRYFIENISRYARRGMDVLGIEVEVVGDPFKRFADRNFMIVSNHLSYIDILCLSSVHPCLFVTSTDMGEAFFLGRMAELGGSIFIERRHRGHIERDLSVLTTALKQGFNVAFYPEGTSTNGDSVLPFKKSLLMAAVEAGVDILPMTIKYTEIDGEPFSPKNRDKVCWYGDMTFGPHLLGLLSLQSVKARLEFLEPIKVTPQSTRHELAAQAYAAIYENFTGRPNVATAQAAAGGASALR